MISVRCVCWCATCDRHTHMYMYIYIIYIYIHVYICVYILLVRICPHARKHCGFLTGENESSTARSKLHTKRGKKKQSPQPFCSKHNKAYSDCHELFVSWLCKRFAGDPTQLAQVLAAHITSPTCIENCADRKHVQKRIVKHADLLLDLRALWPKLYFCQSTMTEREKQKRQDKEREREHEQFFKKKKKIDQDDDCM